MTNDPRHFHVVHEGYEISTDTQMLHIDLIHEFLSTSYWASGISRDLVCRSIAGSLAFGLYRRCERTSDCGHEQDATAKLEQIGFARVITDGATFAYLADVFVLKRYRGQGLGRWLIQSITEHPDLQSLRRFLLFTEDAHTLYAKMGFTPLEGSRSGMHIYRGQPRPAESPQVVEQLAIASQAAYRPRRIECVGTQSVSGWHLKIYKISRKLTDLPEAALEAAYQFADDNVSWPAHVREKFGFLTLHAGDEGIWLLVDLWAADIMHHFLFRAPLDNPTAFASVPQDGTNSCVWEMEVILHERNAWVEHTLSRTGDPDFQGYLEDTLRVDA